MKIFVFIGPTISEEEARAELDAIYLPPVAQGDVYRATLERPQAIGIVDGYFERIPAVWHKEILWAMAEGVHVFGSASMGALRAVELASFGMEGVGAVFEAFRSGALEDDDEVAVAHGAADQGYRILSEAMVNIRSTLAVAVAMDVIRPATGEAIERLAKALFYPDRSYPLLLEKAMRAGVPAAEIEALRAFLPRGAVNQKREDARAMLRLMRDRQATLEPPKRVRYSFAHTDAWEEVRRQTGRRQETEPAALPSGRTAIEPLAALYEELRLRGDWVRIQAQALARALALEVARGMGRKIVGEGLQRAVEEFRIERGLLTAEDVERWLAEQQLGQDQLGQLCIDEAQLRWIATLFAPEVSWALPDQLRAGGEFGALWARAHDKQQVLAAGGLTSPGLGDTGLSEEQLWHWFFVQQLGRPLPEDLEHDALAAGFSDVDALRRAVLREFCYLRAKS